MTHFFMKTENLLRHISGNRKVNNSKFSMQTSIKVVLGVEIAALIFRTKQYSTSYGSHICYGKRFCNDFFLNHNTIALEHNCLKLLGCLVIETALDGM